MPDTVESDLQPLFARLDQAVALDTVGQRAGAVKRILAEAIRDGEIQLPTRFFEPRPDTYARRLLHRDLERGYSAVVMTWGPGQGTALHDHAGIWCVEGTIHGEMEVLQYEIDGTDPAGRFHFAPRGRVRALPGASGALIPPFEYHVLRNAKPDDISITLHVYGGEMDHCHLFHAEEEGWHRRVECRLSYHD
jgi:predicted metal-dependent enzyme (double-stranded beta helix superfamily)